MDYDHELSKSVKNSNALTPQKHPYTKFMCTINCNFCEQFRYIVLYKFHNGMFLLIMAEYTMMKLLNGY